MPRNNVIFENVTLMFRNFSGVAGRYNPAGSRNFSILIDPEVADQMARDGWNVKQCSPKNSGDPILYHLPVAVSYKKRPPKIVLIGSKGKTLLSEDDLSVMDFSSFVNVDVSVNPYVYNFDGHSGIKAYLDSMWATIYEDELELKYQDVPDSAVNAIKPNMA